MRADLPASAEGGVERRMTERSFPPRRLGRPAVWGILNVTPDSFSDGGEFTSPERAESHARALVSAGADVIDLGGESTRPGSEEVSVDTELARVLPVLDRFGPDFPVPISIDTRRAEVAAAAAERGATILNDTAALRDDPEIAQVAAEFRLHVVLMHRRGVPKTMQSSLGQIDRPYEDVIEDVRAFFEARVEYAVSAGISRADLILDPGIGFGKRPEDNDHLIARVSELRLPGHQLLVGASRKRFLARFDQGEASDRIGGSLAVAAVCAQSGVDHLRVHDVERTVSFLRTMRAFSMAQTDRVKNEEVV